MSYNYSVEFYSIHKVLPIHPHIPDPVQGVMSVEVLLLVHI